jgi:hypothetical protein
VRLRMLSFFAALLGAAVIAPAALAAPPSEVKLEIAQNCHLPDWPCWNVKGNNQDDIGQVQPFTIAQGGTISFEDSDSEAPTDVIWKGAAPSCTSGVPVTPPTKTGWSGTCTFTTAGDYEFESQGLFKDASFDYTKYEVVVETPGAPVVATGVASAVTETEGTLQATVDPEGKETKYFFEWGTSESYGNSTTELVLGSEDTSSHDVSASLPGLTPGTTYHYRVVAKNGVGTTDGEDRTLTTASPPGPPSATTGQASVLSETTATLAGAVGPDGQMTSYYFQWGTSESYGHSTGELPAGSDHTSHAETAALSELQAGTVYHFRIVAKNQTETVTGSDETFMTASPPPTKPQPSGENGTGQAPSPTPTGGSPTATATSTSSPSSGQPRTEAASGPPLGSIKFTSTQHGGVVRGSLVVSSAASGGQLQIELLAKGTAAPVGKLARSSLRAGTLTFALPLNAKGKAALRRHRRLALTVKITLTPQHGEAVTTTRVVTVRG